MRTLKNTIYGLLLTGLSMPVLAEVDVNKASKDQLMEGIKGLNEKRAEAIIDYRERTGAFVHLNELTIAGVGRDIMEPNYENLSVGSATAGDKKGWSFNSY